MTIVARQCFEYSADISMCLEVIRPDFSPFEKSNTPKGQKNNKRLQSCSLAQQFSHKQSLQRLDNLQSITSSSKSTKQNCCKHFCFFKKGQLRFVQRMARWTASLIIVCDRVGVRVGCSASLHTRAE